LPKSVPIHSRMRANLDAKKNLTLGTEAAAAPAHIVKKKAPQKSKGVAAYLLFVPFLFLI